MIAKIVVVTVVIEALVIHVTSKSNSTVAVFATIVVIVAVVAVAVTSIADVVGVFVSYVVDVNNGLGAQVFPI